MPSWPGMQYMFMSAMGWRLDSAAPGHRRQPTRRSRTDRPGVPHRDVPAASGSQAAACTDSPPHVALLAVAILATFIMMPAPAMATAGLTGSPEQARVTTLGWVVVAIALALRLSRWEPRR